MPVGSAPSSIWVKAGAMLNTIQWSQIPAGASGSSIIRTRLFACSGTPLINSDGFMSFPSHVNLVGMLALLPKFPLLQLPAVFYLSSRGYIRQSFRSIISPGGKAHFYHNSYVRYFRPLGKPEDCPLKSPLLCKSSSDRAGLF